MTSESDRRSLHDWATIVCRLWSALRWPDVRTALCSNDSLRTNASAALQQLPCGCCRSTDQLDRRGDRSLTMLASLLCCCSSEQPHCLSALPSLRPLRPVVCDVERLCCCRSSVGCRVPRCCRCCCGFVHPHRSALRNPPLVGRMSLCRRQLYFSSSLPEGLAGIVGPSEYAQSIARCNAALSDARRSRVWMFVVWLVMTTWFTALGDCEFPPCSPDTPGQKLLIVSLMLLLLLVLEYKGRQAGPAQLTAAVNAESAYYNGPQHEAEIGGRLACPMRWVAICPERRLRNQQPYEIHIELGRDYAEEAEAERIRRAQPQPQPQPLQPDHKEDQQRMERHQEADKSIERSLQDEADNSSAM